MIIYLYAIKPRMTETTKKIFLFACVITYTEYLYKIYVNASARSARHGGAHRFFSGGEGGQCGIDQANFKDIASIFLMNGS